MNRRNFLQIMLATCSAPAIVRAASLMPIYVPSNQIVRLEGRGLGWLWDDQGLILTLGEAKPNEWIQQGLLWTLDAEVYERRILANIPGCIEDTSCGK